MCMLSVHVWLLLETRDKRSYWTDVPEDVLHTVMQTALGGMYLGAYHGCTCWVVCAEDARRDMLVSVPSGACILVWADCVTAICQWQVPYCL